MIFPKGEVRHQNLLTAYTDVSALLSALKSEAFSGILEIEFPEKRGIIFIDSGEVLNAEINEKGGAGRTIGKEGIQAFLTSSNQKNGVLNVYRLLPEQVALITSHLQHEVLFKELSTDYTRLDRLFLKLKEDKHDGFVEVLTKEKKAIGVLFVEGGEPVEMFTLPESGPSVFGRKFIPAFLENVSKQGGVMLNVYKTRSQVSRKERPVPETKPVSEGNPTLEHKPPVTGRNGLQEVIPILQETLSGAERLVDAASRNGIFIGAFKKCLIEKAETFSFLDPFAGEFEYQDGVIRFSGAVGEKEFTKGILECLNTTVILLEKELPKNKMLSLKLGVQIKSSLEQHSDTLKRLGLTEVVSSSLR